MVKVIDGDTFILQSGQRIRLGNLYAPEPEFCGGKQAKEELENLILGKKVKLDIFSHDQFNRPLASVYVGDTLVNEVILRKGWARYDGTPSAKRELLKQAFDSAVTNKRGIFSPLCLSLEPEKPNCRIKGNIDRGSGKKLIIYPNVRNILW